MSVARMTEQQLQDHRSRIGKSVQAAPAKKKPRHKFNAQPTVNDGIRFDSKLEAKYYQYLKLLKHQGEVLFWLRQTPIHLAGGTKLVIDFQVFYSDGRVEFIDVKGLETKEFKIKKREVEVAYPFEIKVVKKGDF